LYIDDILADVGKQEVIEKLWKKLGSNDLEQSNLKKVEDCCIWECRLL
jgi:hypothetical protein